jgi:Fe-S oxidoreductase
MFSQEATKHISNCYMCWMCRHVCPVGNISGREIHFPRGKGLLLNLTIHGNDVLKDSAKAMYDCFLCNNCSSWCETGFEPTLFIREARRELVANDYLPANIQAVVDRTLETTLYGEKKMAGSLKEVVDALPDTAPVLLVLGDAVVMRQPEIGLASISLLKKAGVNFTVLKNEPTPAADLYDLIGELSDVQVCAKNFTDAVKKTSCETVVAVDPFTARILIQDYPRWGSELPTVLTATSYFAGLLTEGKLTVKTKLDVPVTYHDSERLARDLEETEEPRKIIDAMAEPWKEIFLNRKNTRCCGNDVVDAYSPEIVQKTSRLRMDDALRTGAKLLITSSASDKGILSRVEGEALKVEDILVLLDSCC